MNWGNIRAAKLDVFRYCVFANSHGPDRIVGSAGHDILVADDVADYFTEEALRQISAAWAATKTVNDAVDDVDRVLCDLDVIDSDDDFLCGVPPGPKPHVFGRSNRWLLEHSDAASRK